MVQGMSSLLGSKFLYMTENSYLMSNPLLELFSLKSTYFSVKLLAPLILDAAI